jgi:hypothetical protein
MQYALIQWLPVGLLMISQQVKQRLPFQFAVFSQLPKLIRGGGRCCRIFGLIYKEIMCKCRHIHINYTLAAVGWSRAVGMRQT